ncbi:Magnesium transporter protein 1 [Trichinella pseudospiralis]|uniref:Magnesium transporter protein 1 n=1 Tax=Trichinella pseudospiralis TaxID=6337 RepID=A0A0V1FCX0_TRIPS|nr:Magnesium transporter protein 1 [Trichinella pseudospiralis]
MYNLLNDDLLYRSNSPFEQKYSLPNLNISSDSGLNEMESAFNPGDHRRKWDKVEYERLARERLEEEEESEKPNERFESREKKIREYLKPRDYKIDLDSKVGKSVVITKSTPASEAGGYYCNVCDCIVKDSINFLDHINGKKHQRNMGMSMRIKKSTLEDVRARFSAKKQEAEERKKSYDIEERLREIQEEERKMAEYKKQKRLEKSKRKRADLSDDEDDKNESDVSKLMGFNRMNASYWLATTVLCLIFLPLINPQRTMKEQLVSLEEKVTFMQDWLAKRSVLRLNNAKFQQYVRSSPRNYSVIILLTSQSNRQCRICGVVQDEFEVVASSYRFTNMNSKRLYFVLADYEEAGEVFHTLGISAIPIILHVPPRGNLKRQDKMDFQRSGIQAEAIAKWVQERTDVVIPVMRPPNYAGPVALFLLLMLVCGLLYMKRSSLDFLYNRNLWGFLALCITFAFLSGQMWNHIRSPPFFYHNPKTGQWTIFSQGTQMQFIVETYIVGLIYMAITMGFILLIDATDMKTSSSKTRFYAYAGIGLVVIVFSFLLSVFRLKYRGYPYRDRLQCIYLKQEDGEQLFEEHDNIDSGYGCFVAHCYYFASLAGKLKLTKKNNGAVVEVVRENSSTRILPSPQAFVTCRVTGVANKYAKCTILMVENNILPHPFVGILRKENVYGSAKNESEINMYECFQEGDIVIAKVSSLGDSFSYLLSTEELELGVYLGYCKEKHKMQPTADKRHLHCGICLTKEPRKIADLESDEEILKWKKKHYGKR